MFKIRAIRLVLNIFVLKINFWSDFWLYFLINLELKFRSKRRVLNNIDFTKSIFSISELISIFLCCNLLTSFRNIDSF